MFLGRDDIWQGWSDDSQIATKHGKCRLPRVPATKTQRQGRL